MTFNELKKLVAQGEGVALEFKRKANFPEKIMKEVVAFANTHGGKLLIGVDDDGSIPGLKYASEDEFVLRNAIEKYCHPAVSYELEKIVVSPNRHVLSFQIHPHAEKPVFVIYNFKRKTGVCYVRVVDRSIQASREMRNVLKGMSHQWEIHFEYGENERALMRYLATHARIDVETYAAIAAVPLQTASETLVRLTLANVLRIHPDEGKDFFTVKEQK